MESGQSIIMGCAAIRIVQQTAKVADASDSLYELIRELGEAIADAGGHAGISQQLSEIRSTAVTFQNALANALYIIPLLPIAGHIPNAADTGVDEVLGNIREARLRKINYIASEKARTI